jgi:O-antigen/teichoic acid export membrane protein
MAQTANRIVKNTGFLYAKMGITMFVSLYTTRLVLKTLGASDFGIFNIVGGTIALLGFINTSMASSTQRFMSYAQGEGDRKKQISIFNVSTVLHFFLSILAAIALFVAGYFFFNGILNIPEERVEAAKVVYGSLIVSTIFAIMSVPYGAILNAHENMRYYAFVGIIESVLKLAVAFVCVYTLSDKLIVYGVLMALVPIITLTIMRIYCHRKYEECIIAPRRYYNRSLTKEMTSFAGWSFFNSMASMGTMQGMTILLNMFGGVIVNTAHGIANQLAGQLMVFSNNMLKALNPVLVKSQGAGDTLRMLKVAATGNKLSFSFYAIFAIPFIVETPYILDLWLDQTPQWAVLFVRLVLFRQILSQLTITLETCVRATGKIKNMTICGTFIWAFPIVFGYVLYKMNFPIYTIYILLIMMVLMRSCNALYFCKKLCGLQVIPYLYKSYLPSCIVMAILFAVLYFIHINVETDVLRLVAVCAVGIILFAILCYLIVFNQSERELISSMFNQVKQKFMIRR